MASNFLMIWSDRKPTICIIVTLSAKQLTDIYSFNDVDSSYTIYCNFYFRCTTYSHHSFSTLNVNNFSLIQFDPLRVPFAPSLATCVRFLFIVLHEFVYVTFRLKKKRTAEQITRNVVQQSRVYKINWWQHLLNTPNSHQTSFFTHIHILANIHKILVPKSCFQYKHRCNTRRRKSTWRQR